MSKVGSESRPFTGQASKPLNEGTYLERTEGHPGGGSPPAVANADGFPAILRGQPALEAKDWLPEGIFPELDELREEHHRLLDETFAARDKCIALRSKYEGEDKARAAALATGEEPPPVTGSADRQDALGEAEAQLWASWHRVGAFVERAVEVFKEKGGERPEFPDEPGLVLPEWRQQMAAVRAEAAEEMEVARAALAKAERKEADAVGIDKWIDRLVKPKGGRYISAPQPGTFPTRSRLAENEAPPAMAGTGMGG